MKKNLRIPQILFRVLTAGNWISMSAEQQGLQPIVRSSGQLPDLGLDLENSNSI